MQRVTSAQPVLVTREAAVATITLNRPEAMNALDTAAKQLLLTALHEAAGDAEVRAVVLTGTGRGFCTGQDLKEHVALIEAADPKPLSTVTEHYNPIVTAIATMAKPVVAAVNGMAAGAGASFAFAADYRIAAQSARFLMAFAKIGLSVDSGATWTLPRLIGHARAAELMLLARPVDAARAFDLGMVNEVVPDEELAARAADLAAELASGPTMAYAAIKSALAFSAGSDLPTAMANEAEHMASTGLSQDHRDAVAAFVAKRQPVFHGR